MLGMARFVLLYHDCPAGYERPSHWDLMLEADGSLRTWALRELPRGWEAARERTVALFSECAPVSGANSVPAERLADHRIDYLEIEGPLSGERGVVRRVDAGNYEVVSGSAAGCRVRLTGENLSGEVLLTADRMTMNPR